MVVHLFLAVALGSLAKSPQQKDSGLLQALTLKDKIVPLSYLASQLEAATHLHYSVVEAIKHRKVTVSAQGKTVWDVMGAIQSSLFL